MEDAIVTVVSRNGGASPDIIVVGGGVTGTSIAWRLAAAGKSVLLLEQRGICTGASGRNAGHTGAGSSLHASNRAGQAVYALTTANFRLMQTLPTSSSAISSCG
jgi:glycine/D-amino acid oxidase-like deaminating enzyme